MTHRPYPLRERARRQIDRHQGKVEPWSAARPPRQPEPADDSASDPLWVGEYRISTR
ncbi:hypothetical protein ACF1AY_38975 [Streptomyces sp. NPDC014776]|uniref:hypothetical protein n=1 Tax=unclassified Streptomyces TaxID=2593676 RepID=UPI003700DCB6